MKNLLSNSTSKEIVPMGPPGDQGCGNTCGLGCTNQCVNDCAYSCESGCINTCGMVVMFNSK